MYDSSIMFVGQLKLWAGVYLYTAYLDTHHDKYKTIDHFL